MRLTEVPASLKIIPRREYLADVQWVDPLEDEELEAFLADVTDLDSTIDYWNRTTKIPILRAEPAKEQNSHGLSITQFARKLVEYYFDEDTGVYRYLISGRKVPAKRIQTGLIRMTNATRNELRALTEQMVNGEISRDTWYRTMRKTLKDEYRASWITSIGGVDNYDKRQQALFGRTVSPQYKWLNNFLDELNSGEQPLNGTAIQRAGMYGRAGNAIFSDSQLITAKANGMTKVRRVLGPTESHCHDSKNRSGCIELASLGWVDINQVVPIGSAACYSNCLCRYEFKRK